MSPGPARGPGAPTGAGAPPGPGAPGGRSRGGARRPPPWVRLGCVAAAGVLGLGCAASLGAGPPRTPPLRLVYAVRWLPDGPPDAPGATLEVTLDVLGDAPPAWLFARPPAAWLELGIAVTDAAGRLHARTPDADGRLRVPPGARRLAWRYPLARAAGRGDLVRGHGADEAWVVGGAAYLLRPEAVPLGTRVALAVEGAPRALPWPDDALHDLPARAVIDPGFHVFGARAREVEVGGARLRLARAGAPHAEGDAAIEAWLAQAAREVLSVRPPGAGFPVREALVVAATLPGSREASPFGQVLWSDPPSLALYLGGEADAEARRRDWVAVHELCHLAHPPFEDEGRVWLAEGLATYLSLLARARSGRWTPAEAWGELAWGVRAGRAEARPGDTLRGLAREVHARRAYRAVYWGATVACLALDLAVRRGAPATAGARGLEHAVADLRARAQAAGRDARVEDLVAALDAQAGAPFAAVLVARHLDGPLLADAPALLTTLGVRDRGRGEEVDLDDGAPGARLRGTLERGGP